MQEAAALNVSDPELIQLLTQRDGRQPLRTPRHQIDDECRLAGLLKDRPCPWCEAERRHQARLVDAV